MSSSVPWAVTLLFIAGATMLVAESPTVVSVAVLITVGLVLWLGIAALAQMVPHRPAVSAGPAVDRRYALSFRSSLTFDEMIEVLRKEVSWECHMRYKDAWGDYLFARMRPAPYHAVVILIADGDRYVANIKLEGDVPGGEKEYADVHQQLVDVLRSALAAKRIAKTDYFE